MKLGKSIYWHQGLFLQPQHFQYMEVNQQSLVHAAILMQKSYPWGLVELSINKNALTSGIFECDSFSILFKDGSLLSFPENCAVSARNFEGHWPDKSKALNVFIGLPRESKTDSNITVITEQQSMKHVLTRFLSDVQGENYVDRYEGGQETAIKQLSFAPHFYFQTEMDSIEDTDFIAVARLIQEHGEVRLDSQFIPPGLCLSALPSLHSLLDDLKNNLQGRTQMLKNLEGSMSQEAGSNTHNRNRIAMMIMAGAMGKISGFQESPAIEPVTIYTYLRELIGELSLFSNQYNVLGESSSSENASLTEYEHDNLTKVFSNAIKVIGNLLGEITVGPELLVTMSCIEPGKFTCSLGSEFFDHKSTVYLVMRSSVKLYDWLHAFRDFSKLGATGQAEVYARRSLPGINILKIDGKPLGVKAFNDATYFVIERQGHEWGYVEDSGQLCLIWDDCPDDLQIDVLAVRG